MAASWRQPNRYGPISSTDEPVIPVTANCAVSLRSRWRMWIRARREIAEQGQPGQLLPGPTTKIRWIASAQRNAERPLNPAALRTPAIHIPSQLLHMLVPG